jgi:Fis family transcriptional regulator
MAEPILMTQPTQPTKNMRSVLEAVISEMVEKGILWPEAAAEFEKLFMLEALRKHRGNLCKAAETLGIHRNTLSKKMREYGIAKGRRLTTDD